MEKEMEKLCEKNRYLAKCSEDCNRFEDVLDYLHVVAEMTEGQLSADDKSMLTRAYRAVILPQIETCNRLIDMTETVDADEKDLIEGYMNRVEQKIHSAREKVMRILKFVIPIPHVTDAEYEMNSVDDNLACGRIEFQSQKPLIGWLISTEIHELIKHICHSKLRRPTKEFERFLEEAMEALEVEAKSEIVELIEDNLWLALDALSKVQGVYDKLLMTQTEIKRIKVRLILKRKRLGKRRLILKRRRLRRRRERGMVKGGAEKLVDRLRQAVDKITVWVANLLAYLPDYFILEGHTVLKVSSGLEVYDAGSIKKMIQGFKLNLQIATKFLPVKAAYLVAAAVEEGFDMDNLLISY